MAYEHTSPRDKAGEAAGGYGTGVAANAGIAHALVHLGDQFGRIADAITKVADAVKALQPADPESKC